MNILLTCAGRRSYLAQYFKDFLGESGKLIGADMSALAPALAICDKAYETPPVSDDRYLGSLVQICVAEKIDFVFSLNDLELQLIADNVDYLKQHTNATFVVSSSSVIDCCGDKFKTYQFCVEHGVATPKTFIDLDEVESSLHRSDIEFPLIVKPRWGSASIGIFKVVSLDELHEKFRDCLAAISNSVLSTYENVSNSVIIQEFICGAEYGVDVLNDLSGNLVGYAAKLKVSMRAGETDKSITVDPSRFSDSVHTIATRLRHIGNLDCDFLEKNGEIYLVEMNARFGGGYPFTHMAGANHIDFLLNDTKSTNSSYEYEVGKCFAKCDILVDLTSLSMLNIADSS